MEETTLFNGLGLPTAWKIDDKSQFVTIDSSELKVNYTDPNDYEAVVIRANNPIPSQYGLFYFEIEIINEGKNGMIGIGYCTKQNNISDFMPENRENKSWGCAYHGDDGDFFCSGSGKPYGPTFTVGDTIGCYLNFRNDDKMIFYTKNGINLGIACYLPNNLDDLKNNLYPCIGLRSQDASVEANFGRKKFKYLTMINDQYVDELKNKSNDTFALMSRGKEYLIIGKYKEAYEDFTRLLEIESENIIALKYRGEINYIMERYKESISDLETY
ncbi:concanavalin A-like lectin/glucanase domain-containing protein [Gigaspora rosea]|uniref:Concanavalin A-like lectin/glucanase domain-containing protein n=1 Tax=Gigaspora rosea TaxID=44941 RepID=A0A397UAG5_9GLOM|nr:concanavalin A-like lectin/glucanase domain-containing protein [Gigaspora rosea]